MDEDLKQCRAQIARGKTQVAPDEYRMLQSNLLAGPMNVKLISRRPIAAV